MAESTPDPQDEFYYQGTALATSPMNAVRPIIVIYTIETQKFQTVTQIPEKYSPGNLAWKPDSTGVVGKNAKMLM